MTFAKATPLVYLNKEGPQSVSDATRSNYNLRLKMKQALELTDKQFKVKFDILSNRFIKEICRHGSRLLHITSDIGDKNTLCVEGSYGICNELPMKRLD